MRRFASIYVIILLSMSGTATQALAVNVLVATSIKSSGYNSILNAVQSACDQISIKTVNLADNEEVNLPQIARSARAKVIIALGDKAFNLANSTVRVPVIGAMVTDQKHHAVSFIAPPGMYLASIKKLGRKQVGVIYSDQMTTYVRQAVDVARQYGITIVRREANSPSEAMEQFAEIKGQIDSLWIVPDTKIITAGTAEFMLRGGQEKNLPVIAFSQNYLKIGAILVIEPDRESIGRAIGAGICAMAESDFIIEKNNLYRVFLNEAVMRRFEIPKTSFR